MIFREKVLGLWFFASGKMASWDHNGTGALFWCEMLNLSLGVQGEFNPAADPSPLPGCAIQYLHNADLM